MKLRLSQSILILAAYCQLGACIKSDVQVPENEIPIHEITPSSSAVVDTVFSYMPGPGQFVNTDLGNIETVQEAINQKPVSLGAWGGTIILGFDHTVLNSSGADIKITGNATEKMAEAGVVWVMRDTNGNGQPDETWYELKGSAYGQEGYIRDFSIIYYKPEAEGMDIAWKSSDGMDGVLKANKFHDQSFYPGWVEDNSYKLSGTLLPVNNIDTSNAAFVTSMPFEFGYADNTAGGDELEIDSAIDADGNAVGLDGLDFVKIQTGVLANLGSIGEFSTEVSSVQDLHMKKK